MRSSAQKLLSDFDAKLQTLDRDRSQRAEHKSKVIGKWQAIFRSPAVLVSAGLAIAIAGVTFWLLHVPELTHIAVAVYPERVSVAVDGKTCITPDCKLALPPGEYQVRLTKEGYVPQTVALKVEHGYRPSRLAATLSPVPPALQIGGNMSGAGIYLDGAKVGTVNAGQFTLPTIAKGAHVLAIAGEEGKASLTVFSKDDGSLAVQGPVSSTDLSILAVAQEDEAESLITSVLSPQPVYVDNQRVGVTSGGLLHLRKLGEGTHQIQVGGAGGLLRFSLPGDPRPSLYTFIAGKGDTGTLSVSTNVSDADLIVDGKRYPGAAGKGKFQLLLPAKTYEIHSERAGYVASDPVRVTVDRSSETSVKLRLMPRPVVFEIRGAAAGTTVTVDGVPAGVVAGDKPLRREVSPGTHRFELVRDGFNAKRFQRRIEPGETAVFTGSDVELTPVIDTEAQEWAKASAGGKLPELQDFLRKYPNGPHSAAATQKIQQTVWDSVNKQSISALQAYIGNYPQSPHAAQARQILDGLQEAEKLHTEQTDWSAADKDSRKSIEDFLAKHPAGPHAEAAGRILAGLRKKEDAAQLDRAEGNAWSGVNVKDRQALESYIKLFPSGRHRGDADRALSNLNTSDLSPDESPAVLAAVQRLADAWNRKDSQAIVAAQPSLNRRAIKAQLDALSSIRVTITPQGAPQISGDHARVICRRRVEQVFSDGTQKSPESTITVVLIKTGSQWVIESAM